MTEELNKTEARQGDRRKMNLKVLIIGLALVIVIFLLIYGLWAPAGQPVGTS